MVNPYKVQNYCFILENKVVPVIAVAFTAIYSSVATYCYYEKSF